MQASLIGPGGQRTELQLDVLTIGRAPDNRLVLQDQQASSHHAEIRPDAQGYLLVDANSRNGTFVNEQQLMAQTPRLLFSGDVIRIGETRLTYATGGVDDATVRASGAGYGNAGYAPTVAVPPSQQSDFASYQQPAPPAYTNYPQQPPSAPNYPQAEQPGYAQPPQAYPTPAYPQPPQSYPQQAPWAGTPGQFGAPAAPGAPAAAQPRRRSTGLIVGVIVLLVLVVGGALLYFLVIRSTPDKTLTAFCSAIRNNNANDAYNLLSARNTSQETEPQFATQFAQLESGINSTQAGGLRDCTVSNVQQPNNSAASGDITLSVNNSPTTANLHFTLVNENGTWKLDQSQLLPTQ